MNIKKILCLIFILSLSLLVITACNKDDPNLHVVSFDTDGGTELRSMIVENGLAIGMPEDPTKDGYIFKGWYFKNEPWDFANTPVEKDITLVAKWAVGYTVSFDSDGGSTVQPIKVEAGERITAPATPTKEDHKFLGWYVNDAKWDFKSGAVSENLTLKAKWIHNSDIPTYYLISFILDGGKGVSDELKATEVLKGTKITRPTDPTKDRYKFEGWYFNGIKWDFENDTVTSDVVLTAKWGRVYTVSFDTDGGTALDDIEVSPMSKITAPEEPTKEGFIFDGWYLDDNLWDFDYNTVGSSITLRARWIPVFNVSFDSDGGSSVESLKVLYGNKIESEPQTQRTGFEFDGWYLGEARWDFENGTVTSDITLKARWIPYLTVVFNTNGGTEIQSQTVLSGQTLTRPENPTKPDYIFKGWTYLGKAWSFITPITESITLDAHWEEDKPIQLTVSFDLNGGVGNTEIADRLVEVGATLTEPTPPTKDGYAFVGWSYNNEKWDFSLDMVTCDMTLVATWLKTYTVTFDTNGSEDEIPQRTYLEGQLIEQPPIPTLDGYIFEDWFVDGEYWDFETPISSDITLVAGWIKLYEVSFDTDGAGEIPSQLIPMGDSASMPDAPIKTGYRFDGWYFGEVEWDFLEYITYDVVLTAKWVKTATVSFDTDADEITLPPITVDYNTLVDIPSTPVRDGYEFIGWYFGEEPWDFDNNIVTTDITLTAKWIRIYTVIIDYNCDEIPEPLILYVYEGDKIELYDIPSSDDGTVILYWKVISSGEDRKWDMRNDVVTEGLSLKAIWGESDITITPDGTIVTKPDDFGASGGN